MNKFERKETLSDIIINKQLGLESYRALTNTHWTLEKYIFRESDN